MKININKTKILNFNSSKYININLQIIKSQITNVDEYRYLGIIIDKNLNFKNHIKTLNNTSSKILYSINKLSKYINTKPLITIYNSIFLPHLMYGNVNRGVHVYKSTKSRLKLTHTQILRIINKTKNFYEPIEPYRTYS